MRHCLAVSFSIRIAPRSLLSPAPWDSAIAVAACFFRARTRLHEFFNVKNEGSCHMSGLKGKSIIVTGGGSGIGRAAAEILCDAGAFVTVADVE